MSACEHYSGILDCHANLGMEGIGPHARSAPMPKMPKKKNARNGSGNLCQTHNEKIIFYLVVIGVDESLLKSIEYK